MSTDTPVAELPQCARCGTRYRPSNFQRRCLCPVCGRSLEVDLQRKPLRLSPVWAYGAIAVCLGVGVTALAARNFTNRAASAATSSAREARSFSVSDWPADFESLVQDKIRFLKRELTRSPDDPVLLSALGDAHTYRALAARDVNGGQDRMRNSLAQVQACISRLEHSAPLAAEQLRRRLNVFDQLVFVDRPAGSAAARAWRLGVGREIFPRDSDLSASPSASASASASVAVGVGRPIGAAPAGSGLVPGGAMMPPMGGAPGSPPAVVGPGSPVSAIAPPPFTGAAPNPAGERGRPYAQSTGSSGGGGQMATASGIAARILPRGGFSRSTSAFGFGAGPAESTASIAIQVDRLRVGLRKKPGDPALSDELGRLLLMRGSRYVPSREPDDDQRAMKRDLHETASVYRAAAEKSARAVERAAFLDAAADVHRQLEEWEAQYRLLLVATKSAPFADSLWRKLEKAALRQGEMDVCRTARQNAAKWAFPAIDVAMIPPPASR